MNFRRMKIGKKEVCGRQLPESILLFIGSTSIPFLMEGGPANNFVLLLGWHKRPILNKDMPIKFKLILDWVWIREDLTRKIDFFRALPKLPPPNLGKLYNFFWTSKNDV